MARTKAAPKLADNVVAVSGVIDGATEIRGDKAPTGANVVTVCSRLSRNRVFILDNETRESVEIYSANDVIRGGAGIPLMDGKSILFTLERAQWEKLLALYGEDDCFINGLVFECSKSEWDDKDRKAELAAKTTGYESIDPSKQRVV